MLDIRIYMINNGCYLSKTEWSKMIWDKAWKSEDDECVTLYKQPNSNNLLCHVMDKPFYCVWWILSDLFPYMIRDCEIMVKILCGASLLKGHDHSLKRKPHGSRMCILCDLGIDDNTTHLVMQCPFNNDIRIDMYNELGEYFRDTS